MIFLTNCPHLNYFSSLSSSDAHKVTEIPRSKSIVTQDHIEKMAEEKKADDAPREENFAGIRMEIVPEEESKAEAAGEGDVVEEELTRLMDLVKTTRMHQFITRVDSQAGIKASHLSGTAGDMTLQSMIRIFCAIKKVRPITEEDLFVDPGCGFNKPAALIALLFNCPSIGFDHDSLRVYVAEGGLLDIIWAREEGEGREWMDDRMFPRIHVFKGDATEISNYGSATILWIFNWAYDVPTEESIAVSVKHTPSIEIIICSLPKSSKAYEFFEVHDIHGYELVSSIPVKMSGSNSGKTMLIFKKKQNFSEVEQTKFHFHHSSQYYRTHSDHTPN